MSWLSKWWKDGGREAVRDGLLRAASEKFKGRTLEKLRLFRSRLDWPGIGDIRKELDDIISYVEGL